MKKAIFTILVLFFFLASGMAQNQVSILGVGFEDFQKVSLKAYNPDKLNYEILSTKELTDKGEFSFKVKFKNINLYELNFDEKDFVHLSIENSGNIKVVRQNETTTIAGSESSQKMIDFQRQNRELQGKYFGALKSKMDKAMQNGDQPEIEHLQKEAELAVSKFLVDFRKLIVGMGETPAGYFALQYSDFNKELEFIEKRLVAFQKAIPNSPITKALAKQVYQAKTTSIGKTPPNFNVTDIKGEEIQLTNFKGQIVLIDFWAHWCRACRVENPKLAKIFATYRNKGFAVLSISQTVPEKKWKEAIEKDKINDFVNILDANDELSMLYSISSLPQNLLLDKSGKIIAKNINAKQLEKILVKIE